MRKKFNRKTLLLITFGLLFTLSILISNNLNYNDGNSDEITENNILKLSATSNPIHIDNNWTDTKAAGICTGSGTYSDPYVIEDLVIDTKGLGSGILIHNSTVFFRIENCTVYNSGDYNYQDGGIKLTKTSNGIIINNNCSNGNANGILLDNYASNNIISNNTVNHNKRGIKIQGGENNTILGNTINYNQESIYLWYTHYITIFNNTANHNLYGINIEECSLINCSGNIANYNNEYGINIYACGIILIYGSIVNHNGELGINVEDSHYIYVLENIVNYNNKHGIYLHYANRNCTISNNTVNYNNENGIYLDNNADNMVSNNTANYNTKYGISIDYNHNTTILNNIANFNIRGINIHFSYGITVSNNKMDECGLVIFGHIESFMHDPLEPIPPDQPDTLRSHDIDTSNLVNGKPLYYYTNKINLGLSNFTNAGQVILINCNDSIVSNLNVSYNSVGISLYYCNNNTILENTANYNNEFGIYLWYSDYNTISENTANYNRAYETESKAYGIYLSNSNNNLISGNTLLKNDECWKEMSCENNTFENNDCGRFQPAILGFNIFLLIGVISIISASIMKKHKSK
ncbi:MAG: NosD domain-containing protein [Promethearchaeota archaeon]